MPDMLAEALKLARAGWPVFPCNPRADSDKAKRPMVPGADKDGGGKDIPKTGGLYRASTDEVQIRRWWAGRDADALIGVPTGLKIGLFVVDLDPDGEPVEAVYDRLVSAVGAVPAGPRTLTQSGGWHLWFRMPPGDLPKNSARRLANVDWRAEGGYVIVPPSVMRDGAKYTWLVSPEVADFPEATPKLLDLIFRRGEFAPKARAIVPVANGSVAPERIRRYCEVALDRAADRVRHLPKGQRNVELNNIALGIGHLIGTGGITRDAAWTSLRNAAVTGWGIDDSDKALKANGTLDRALDDGARVPADLSHVGRDSRRPEPPVREELSRELAAYRGEVEHDAETGEVIEGDAGGAPPPDLWGPSGGPEDVGPRGEDDSGEDVRKLPFRCLGYNRENYYYFSASKQQITAIKAKEHTTLTLLQLADLSFWGDWIDTRGKITDEQWKQIANSLIQGCHREGIFVETRVRGRGAWMDGKRVVVHTGDSVRIGDDIVPLTDVPGKYIYEAESPWDFEFGSPASDAEAKILADICMRLTWQDRISGSLLAGWCVIALVCGALKWRPHIWITGPSQAGKTTAVEEIVGRIVGPGARRFEGNTSEAGIRQVMGFDALPIILDEAESEDQQAVARMQAILALARVSSSGGTIAKGSNSGRAMSFVARSCFLFSSINTALRHHADESRVTKLILARNEAPDALEHYKALVADINATFTPEYAGAMFSRTIANLPALTANIETFKAAAAVEFRSRRAADQIGPMLAGFYLCYSTGRITLEAATKFIKKHQWVDHLSLEASSDELRLFSFLMSRRVRFQVGSRPEEMSLGQACAYIAGAGADAGAYAAGIGPRGIRVEWSGITISNTADGVREMLRDTQWVNDWRRPLSMIEGAEKTDGAIYFAPGLVTRGITLPVELLSQ